MICCYSTQMVRSHLGLRSLTFTNFLHSTILKRGSFRYQDVALWNKMIIDNVIKRREWDFHVISSHLGLTKKTVEFDDETVHYHYFKGQKLFPYNYLERLVQPKESIYHYRNRRYISGFIIKINPDFIILVGAENPYYSIAALDIHDIPYLVLCQTVLDAASNSSAVNFDHRYSVESQVLAKSPYIGVYCKKHYQQLLDRGYQGYIFEFQWPPVSISELPSNLSCPKEFDFINFAARATDDKGYKDSICALSIVKQKYPHVKLNLKVDPGKEREELKRLVDSLNLNENVSYQESFVDSKDLYKHLIKSRFAVLPCKLDNTSGTMTQSMIYGLPMVVYETTGTPIYNKEKECALIAEMNNIEDLAAKMLILMDDAERAERIKINAQEFIRKRDESRMNAMNRIIADVMAIRDNYYNGITIPKDLLFNPLSE